MECWIERAQQPKQLLFVWQPPVQVRDRSRWAVGRLSADAERTTFAYLEEKEFQELNLRRSEEQLRADSFSGYPAFDRMRQPREGFWTDALQTFLRRVPSHRRSDFSAYLEHHRIKAGGTLSPLALLAVTEAQLPSDGFSLIDPLDSSAAAVDFVFEIAGFRHSMRPVVPFQQGQMLTLIPEPENSWDPSAIQVMAGGLRIGYVNRLQAATILQWLGTREVQCCIARLNGKQDSPRAYALARVRPLLGAMAT